MGQPKPSYGVCKLANLSVQFVIVNKLHHDHLGCATGVHGVCDHLQASLPDPYFHALVGDRPGSSVSAML
jgi:hypothetical protein